MYFMFTSLIVLAMQTPSSVVWWLALILGPAGAQAQKKPAKIIPERLFQFSVAPGLSTNGMHPGTFNNYFSFNLTSGYSASNRVLEIAGISNLNQNETRGLQVAGLVNLTGANAFAGLQPKEREQKIKSGFEANLSGVQVAGLTNVVINNVFGGQVAGAVNISNGALMGFQGSGLTNIVYKYVFGLQLAGGWNVARQSVNGVQAAGLANYTEGGLYGLQLGGFNYAGLMEGKNSFENDDPTAVQIGLLNRAKTMNGFQVGLVNLAKNSQGTQIGLINIYKKGKVGNTRDGTAIGLLNVGDFGHLSVHADELFAFNYELATGNRKNARITNAVRNVYFYNSIIYSRHNFQSDSGRWAFGYAMKKMFFNRSATPGMSEFRFISYELDFLHMNHERKVITKDLNVLTRARIAAGTRLAPKLFNLYVFAGVSYSCYWSENGESIAPGYSKAEKTQNGRTEFWPGFAAGVMLH